MHRRVYLQIPGPTNIPGRVLQALGQPNLDHRGPEFAALVLEVVDGLKWLFRTKTADVLVYPGSGSGGLEAAVVNTLSPGDHVLSLCSGTFSERFASIAAAFGARVHRLDFDWGEAVDPLAVREALEADTEYRIAAVLVTHVETSTGAANDVRQIAAMRRAAGHPALILVDAVSSLGCLPLPMDDWELDLVVTASQKGLMLPPGMAILAVGERAWDAVEQARSPRWFWDFRPVRQQMREGRFPYTPPQPLLFGLRESLAILRDEGLEHTFLRHARLARGVRAGTRALGLSPLVADAHAASSVTSIHLPAGLECPALSRLLREKYGVVIGGGLGRLAGKIFRVAHMGMLHETDVFAIMGALGSALQELGFGVDPAAGVAAARCAMLEQVDQAYPGHYSGAV